MSTATDLDGLRNRLQELGSQMQGMWDEVAEANGGLFTDEQKTAYDGLDAEYEDKLAVYEAKKKLHRRLIGLDEDEAGVDFRLCRAGVQS